MPEQPETQERSRCGKPAITDARALRWMSCAATICLIPPSSRYPSSAPPVVWMGLEQHCSPASRDQTSGQAQFGGAIGERNDQWLLPRFASTMPHPGSSPKQDQLPVGARWSNSLLAHQSELLSFPGQPPVNSTLARTAALLRQLLTRRLLDRAPWPSGVSHANTAVGFGP